MTPTITVELLPEQIALLTECLMQVQLDTATRLELDEAMIEHWPWYDSHIPIHEYVTQCLDSCYRKLTGI